MLLGELVVGAENSAVKEAPGALYGVRVDVAAYPFVAAVRDGFVLNPALFQPSVDRRLVGVDRVHVARDVLLNEPLSHPPTYVRGGLCPNAQVSAALNRTHDHRLVAASTLLPRAVVAHLA